MPNWCWNTIEFNGEQKNLDNLAKLLEKTVDVQNKTGLGQLLHGLEGAIDGFMFDISYDLGDGFLNLSFQSRWSPIVNDVVRIAELFGLTFVYDYEESGMNIFGKYTFEYEDGEDEGYLYDQAASDADVESCRYKLEDDEEDDESGFNYEKLEDIISNLEMRGVDVTRLTTV